VAVHIDYFASLNSPWTHLGAERIEALAAKYDATLRIHPLDFGTIFPPQAAFRCQSGHRSARPTG
jgi:2-hydroxychromene-2-carboxylate isomerase